MRRDLKTQPRDAGGHAHQGAACPACHATPPKYDLIVLDELNIPLRYDHLAIADVVAFLRDKPDMLHVVVTGRNAKAELIEIADLVTEMTMIKHPFRDQGVKAQKGIEF